MSFVIDLTFDQLHSFFILSLGRLSLPFSTLIHIFLFCAHLVAYSISAAVEGLVVSFFSFSFFIILLSPLSLEKQQATSGYKLTGNSSSGGRRADLLHTFLYQQ